MPSMPHTMMYHAPAMHHRYPPTPPEDSLPSYTSATMSVPCQQPVYAQQHVLQRHDDRGYDYGERYSHGQTNHQSIPFGYHQPANYPGYNPAPIAQPNNYYRPTVAPILPPIQNYDHVPTHSDRSHATSQRQRDDGRTKQQSKEERPVGGVSAKLDYDLEEMTDFVAETAQAIVMPTRSTIPGFRKWVHQVLSATRLPSSTILLAFVYLNEHMRNMQAARSCEGTENELHRVLTTSLILGSKFLDDNTFINRSWAEVSGIEVRTLNHMERLWLQEIGFHLHRESNEPHGFQSFLARWKHFQMKCEDTRNARSKPAAINTNLVPSTVAAHHQIYSPVSAHSYGHHSPSEHYNKAQSSYPTPSYSRYDPYGASRSSMETSPPSAPHTSPHTPDYYGAQGSWTSLNGNFGYPRNAPTSYASSGQAVPAIAQNYSQQSYAPMSYAAPLYAKNHGAECFCVPCARNYLYAPHFGMAQPLTA